MLTPLAGIALAALIALLVPGIRNLLLDAARKLSDVAISGFLRGTSRFGSDLNREGLAEQEMWRQQRLRSLRSSWRGDSES